MPQISILSIAYQPPNIANHDMFVLHMTKSTFFSQFWHKHPKNMLLGLIFVQYQQ